MITNTIIAYGDQLGAQMSTLANLVFLAKENNQKLCFYMEYKNFRRRFLILENFNISKSSMFDIMKFTRRFFLPVPEIYCFQFRANKKAKSVANYKRIYKERIKNFMDMCFYRGCRLFYSDFKIMKGKNGVHCDSNLLKLNPKKNYDIQSGFGTYQDWKKYEDVVLDLFHFKNTIMQEGNVIYKDIKSEKPTVSVHFRKGDYLILSSLNLTLDYYKTALSYFEKEKYKLVIFSDDIESCKNTGIFDGYEVHYMDAHSAGLDMYIMSLCDNNIIANSSFSFWGAFLNKNKEKKVVCPHDFIGQQCTDYTYMNGNWYPENWISL